MKTRLVIHKNLLITSDESSIKYDLSITLIEKLSQIIDELSNSNYDLHKLVSTLRYTLEALIVTELLNIENDYFLKVTFSIYGQQINKMKSMIQRLEKELIVLEKYSKKYSENKQRNKQLYANNSEELATENEKVFQNYKKLAQENINISFDKLEEYGFDILLNEVEDDLIKYKEKLEEFENLGEQKYKKLAKQKWFKSYTNLRIQWTEITKLLKDDRKWKEKSEVAKLDNEYELNYDFTSSLLHFTSYSIWTSNTASEEELAYVYFLVNQYIRKITSNIGKFSKVFIFDVFETTRTNKNSHNPRR